MAYLMKGKHWSDRGSFRRKLKYPVYVEPKIDEIRVRVKVGGYPDALRVDFLSYADKPLHNMQQFAQKWLEFAQSVGLYEFDCGFEVNGNFEDSSRWIKSSRGLPPDLVNAQTKFYLFDLPTHGGLLDERKAYIRASLASTRADIYRLEHYKCHCETEVVAAYLRFRGMGFEGAMVKEPLGEYEHGKRSQLWLKMKPEETEDGKIIGFVEATATVANPEQGVSIGDGLGRVGSVVVKTECGAEASPHGISHALGRDMFTNPEKYLGEWVEFAFMERASAGGFRHPTFRRLRDAKD